jgi:hypothetical protein
VFWKLNNSGARDLFHWKIYPDAVYNLLRLGHLFSFYPTHRYLPVTWRPALPLRIPPPTGPHQCSTQGLPHPNPQRTCCWAPGRCRVPIEQNSTTGNMAAAVRNGVYVMLRRGASKVLKSSAFSAMPGLRRRKSRKNGARLHQGIMPASRKRLNVAYRCEPSGVETPWLTHHLKAPGCDTRSSAAARFMIYQYFRLFLLAFLDQNGGKILLPIRSGIHRHICLGSGNRVSASTAVVQHEN